ncbi:MAG: hypothetical protein P0Y48_08625 [Candidatus Microbacterium phytovorans]|uniref:Ig-like domain-containing protein n=1 Tax=Candidatus Microbacterium phytovorans TaxID=3121374 RepID=A0AAJ5W0T7_9MICO|nr:hypothetical protein [Microbacterium sp.]WEK12541.1 MAG: hypothetical protein P0Y48_08625 [Microbacterium sp.]
MTLIRRAARRTSVHTGVVLSTAVLLASVLLPNGGAVASTASTTQTASPASAGLGELTEAPALPLVTIVGSARVGVELTADPGSWPEGASFDYQWLVGGVAVDDATAAAFTPRAADVGKTVQVTVTGAVPGSETISVTSEPTEAVDYGVLSASSLPVISGTVQVGKVVTASAVWWTPSALTSYSWYIDGEWAGGAQRTYFIRPADAGKELTVRVSGFASGYRATSVGSVPVTVAYAELTAPIPTITGSVRIDEVLTVQAGEWTAGTSLRYQWSVDGAPIEGATGTSYTVRHADADKTITVAVSGTKYGYAPVTATSAPTSPVGYGILHAPKPIISGAARVGVTLKVKVGSWTAGSTLSYQWFVGGQPRQGATGTTLALQPSDLGKRISFAVTGSLAGHKTTHVVSAETAAVSPGTLVTAVPTIRGTAKHGVILTAKPGAWSAGTTLSYAWYVGGSRVAGATSASFTPTKAHIGQIVKVKVTGRRAGYTAVTTTSAATKPVAEKSVFRLKTPDITGTPKVGRQLLVSTTVWVPEIRYQWYVGGKAVAGATREIFVPRTGDRGKAITCKVTIRKPGWVSVTKTSEPTAKVR